MSYHVEERRTYSSASGESLRWIVGRQLLIRALFRVRPPALKLASASHQSVDELAWDADRGSATIALAPTHGKNATEYSFGRFRSSSSR